MTVDLDPGQYCLVSTQRAPLQTAFPENIRYDNACLEAEQRRCDAVVVVKAGEAAEPLHITRYTPCYWASPPCFLGPPSPPPP